MNWFFERRNMLLASCIVVVMATMVSCESRNSRIEANIPRESEFDMTTALRNSHIEANVPPESQFNMIIMLALEKFMTANLGKPCTVRYTLLRKGSTQSGVVYPKYYVWVEVLLDGKTIEQGAARVAAIEKTEFHVTDFLTVDKIRSASKEIYRVFPKPVCREIEKRMARTTTPSTGRR